MKLNLTKRPAAADDGDFLYAVYAEVRQVEVGAWGWSPEQRDMFLKMQFKARRQSYAGAYPQAVESVILDQQLPIGSTIVSRTPSELRLIDIAILEAHRNRGVGSALITEFIREACLDGVPVRLSVLRTNPAQHLYSRLGFTPAGGDQMYLELEWRTSS